MTAPYVVTAAGHHRLVYRAADQAGNLSAAESVAFFIGQDKSFYLPLILKPSS